MAYSDKPPWDEPFTGEPRWLREKRDWEKPRNHEREWYCLHVDLRQKLRGFPRDFQRAVEDAMSRAERAGMSPIEFAERHLLNLEREMRVPTDPYSPMSPFKDPERFTRQTPTYTKTPIEPLPEFFCLHFIGGPKSGTEEFWPYRKNYDLIQQGKFFTIAMESPLPPTITESGEITTHQIESYTYKPTFIPRSETPFSDAQIVVCIFQG